MPTECSAERFEFAPVEGRKVVIHTVLTDNGTHFTEPGGNCWRPAEIKAMLERHEIFRAHAFELACAQNDIDHRLTKPKHPWTNGQVERMNRTIKEATVKRFTTRRTRNSEAISATLSALTTSRSDSRPSKASRPTNTSARSGQKSPNDLRSILSIKCRD